MEPVAGVSARGELGRYAANFRGSLGLDCQNRGGRSDLFFDERRRTLHPARLPRDGRPWPPDDRGLASAAHRHLGAVQCSPSSARSRWDRIADLTVIREPAPVGADRELPVRWSPRRRPRLDCALAATLGYGRVWFPDDVVDLGDADIPRSSRGDAVQVCRSRWRTATQSSGSPPANGQLSTGMSPLRR